MKFSPKSLRKLNNHRWIQILFLKLLVWYIFKMFTRYVCVYLQFALFLNIYIFLFKMKLEVLCPFSRCYILYYKWLFKLLFLSTYFCGWETGCQVGRRKTHEHPSKSRLSPIACPPASEDPTPQRLLESPKIFSTSSATTFLSRRYSA